MNFYIPDNSLINLPAFRALHNITGRKSKLKQKITLCMLACCLLLLTGCGSKSHMEKPEITIPDYERITYSTQPAVYGDIAPVLEIKLRADSFERKKYYPSHDEMQVDQVYVKSGDTVHKGDVMVSFASDDIEQERQQYASRVEEDNLLIEHYKNLEAIQGTDEYQQTIEDLQNDRQIASLYIQELDAKLSTYSIVAEGDGIVSIVSEMLNYGEVYASDAVITVLYSSDLYQANVVDDYDFQIGETYTATFGVASYDFVLETIEETGTNEEGIPTRNLTFRLASSAGIPNADSLNMRIEKPVLKDVLYVPKDAVFTVGQSSYVYVLDENGFRHGVEVEVGSTVDDVTIIESGLSEGDKVVID